MLRREAPVPGVPFVEISAMFGKKKPKPILVRKYRAFTSGGARSAMEKDAAKLAEKGYRLDKWDDKSHWYGRRGDITATFVLAAAP